MKQNLCARLFLSAVFVATSGSVLAEEEHDHDHDHDHAAHAGVGALYGHLDVRLHADNIFDAEESDEEFDEVYSHSHLELGVRLSERLSVNTNIKLEGEPSGHSHGHGHGGGDEPDGSDRFFEDHPLLVETLTLNYNGEQFSAYAGKFNPTIGFDYHKFPGVYGYQVIEEYAVRERIGVGGTLKHDAGDYGKHRLDISAFFADTTFLSDSILSKRGRTDEEDGGVANTEDFSSFSISLGGSDFYSLNNNVVEGLSYRVGYARQAEGVDSEDDETRYSASLGYQHRVSSDWSFRLIAEYMDINHLGGEAAHDRAYGTAALGINYRRWNLGTSYTDINNDAEEADENHDGDVFQISAGYRFANAVGLDLGYQRADEEDEVTERMGVLLSYSYDF